MKAKRITTLAWFRNCRWKENKGKIFNKPNLNVERIDVYAGFKHDYTGEEVAPKVFLNILKGECFWY